ncbi:MAG: T9SS type A sorting domain-containing protein [Ignavibacteriales bacterium]|nr:MAG: T9SS type A sorting domain-containing protein [Ignavibacteriales bacterium]
MKSIYSIFLFILIFSGFSLTQEQNKTKYVSGYSPHYQTISINQLKMIISNDGMGSYNPETGGAGLFWPGGKLADKPLATNDGLYWVGKIGDSVFAGASAYNTSYQPGKILSTGLADDPSTQHYRVYKINKQWESYPYGSEREKLEKDFIEWPVEDGAPFYDSNNDGRFEKGIDEPLFYGDEQLWFVANDLFAAQTIYSTGTFPAGVEMQVLIYAFKYAGLFENTLIKVYRLINKGGRTLDSLYIGYFAEAVLGDPNDNFAGCDTILNLGYFYNANPVDTLYSQPPAVGYKLLQGPMVVGSDIDSAKFNDWWMKGFKNLDINSFIASFPEYSFHGNGWLNNPLKGRVEIGAMFAGVELFLQSKGHFWDGSKFNDPLTGEPTNFILCGDPVLQTGWYEGTGWPNGPLPGRRALYMSAGPINFAPGDTQEVAYAIHVAQGNDNIDAIDRLKRNAKNIQYFYDHYSPQKSNTNFKPPLPEYYHLSQNYPNPFNPVTVIDYSLPVKGQVSLRVYDILGNEIKVIVNELQEAGDYRVQFNSDGLSSGVYFYSINSNEFLRTKKMMVIK